MYFGNTSLQEENIILLPAATSKTRTKITIILTYLQIK
jgi:hypothetical protein